jgi:hypothetical protein
MKVYKNNRMYNFILFTVLLFSFYLNLYSQNSGIKLPNGETRYLTKSEPMLFITKENGKVTSVESINLEEEIDIIVSFKGKPLCLQKKGVRLSKIMEVRSEHDDFKNELIRLAQAFQNKMQKSQSLSLDYTLKHEYYQAFNGISLTCKRGIANMIRSLPMVENVYRDREVKTNLDQSVPQIRADRVQNELGLTGEGILVGIVDTGIDYMHPALGEGFGPSFRVIGGYDFINEDADPVDDHGHGTHVAGIVGASSDSLVGVAPGVHFIAAKVLDENGGGWTSTVLAGIDLCLDPDGDPGTDDAVDIMNFSLGSSPREDDPVEIAVDNASEAGILSVVAAGNSGMGSPFDSPYETISCPATAEKALTVGACNSAFILADFSSKGPDPIHFRVKPEIVAPGVNINSSVLNGETEEHSGTSMATPHVVGVAALLKEQHPDWTPEQIKWAIVNSARPLDEEYNAYRQGSGCVDAWNAAHQDIIVQPGILSFGMVDLEVEVWRDTVSFTIENTGIESQQIQFSRDDNLPAAVQLNLSQSSVTVDPGEEESLFAEIVVPSSVPIIDEEPFAYFGSLLCLSSADTVRVPFGFTKANVLVVEFDITPTFIFLWDLNSLYNELIYGTESNKYYIRSHPGEYNILALMSITENTNDYYYVQRKDVEIGGLTYQTISHEEAEFNAFPDPIYDIDNNLRTDEDLLKRVYETEITQSQDDDEISVGMSRVAYSGDNIYISRCDSNISLNVLGLWKPIGDLLVLNYTIKGIQNAEDLIPPSSSENLTQCNVHFCELNENLIVPGLPERDDCQIIWWNHYEFETDGAHLSAIFCDFEKLEFSKISFLKTQTSFNPDEFYTISLGMIRENREYDLGDIWAEENGQIIISERVAFRDRISEQLIERCTIENSDTLHIDPGEEIYLPVVDNFWGGDNTLLTGNVGRMWWENSISPTGVFEDFFSRQMTNQPPVLDFCLYDKAEAHQMVFTFMFFYAYDIQQGVRYHIQCNTQNYYLLGQNGHTTVDYECYVPELGGFEVNSPNIDQLIVLSNNKPAQWLSPAGENNKIRLLFFDGNHDIDQIECNLIPSSGEKIPLELEIDQDKREVFATIPDTLPHEFIDFEVIATDLVFENQTIFTAAPAFFYGNSLEEQIYDSRVFMYQYNLENIEQFPFSAGDSLSFTLDFTNNGNIEADSIVIKYPTTPMFQPMGEDSVVISNLLAGDSTDIALHLQVLGSNSEDIHFVYTPEIHWKTNGKSYKRTYPIYIKTWQPEVTPIYPEPEVSTNLTYHLSDNYPNPFNPETYIRYSIPQSGRVTITLYNVLGQKVRILVDKYQPAGNYVYNFFAGDLPSGIYFYKMDSGEFSQVKKMVLMK